MALWARVHLRLNHRYLDNRERRMSLGRRTCRRPFVNSVCVGFVACCLLSWRLSLAKRPLVTFHKIGEHGRLGNQIFQVAATIGIAEQNNARWAFPKSIETTAVGKLFQLRGESTLNRRVAIRLKEKQETFYEVTLPEIAANEVISLHGYYQSRQYFAQSGEALREVLKISPVLTQAVKEKVPEVNVHGSVTMHVRRGDFQSYGPLYYVLHPQYYVAALDMIKNDIDVVIVVTDDEKWCTENLLGLIPYTTIISHSEDELFDFVLLHLGKHIIIANSSFSWWAAFLKGLLTNWTDVGTVVAPTPWYNRAGRLAKLNRLSFYPPSWKLLETD